MSDKDDFNEKETPVSQDHEILSEDKFSEETWQGDTPPEDDFHDIDPAAGEDEIVEEEMGDDGIYEDETASPAKERGKTIFYGALIVAALLVGGMLFMQFSGSSSSDQPPSLRASLDEGASAPIPAPLAENPSPAASQTTDMSALYHPADTHASVLPDVGQGTAGGGVTDVVSLDAPQPAAAPSAPPAPSISKIEALPVVPSQTPEPVPAAKPEPAPSPSPLSALIGSPAVAEPDTVLAPVATGDLTARLGDMETKLKTLEAALNEATQKNTALIEKMESLIPATGTSLEGRLARLEQQMASDPKPATKSKKAAAKVAPKSEADFDASAGIVTDLLPEEQVLRSQTSALEEPAPVKKVKKTAKKKADKPAKAKKSASKGSSSGLILRAATPEAAWVSGDASGNELQRVTVGETLPGLGRIKEIRQSGDAWELIGSEGVLR